MQVGETWSLVLNGFFFSAHSESCVKNLLSSNLYSYLSTESFYDRNSISGFDILKKVHGGKKLIN